METGRVMSEPVSQSSTVPQGSTSLWWYERQGVVYFFAAGRPAAAIKIGVTTVAKKDNWEACIRQRHEQIQSCNHETIELLGLIRFDFAEGELPGRNAELLERALHKQFEELQLFKAHTRGAEWFRPGAELLGYIQKNAEAPESLKIPRVIGLPINRQP
jgi:hypothetical protein